MTERMGPLWQEAAAYAARAHLHQYRKDRETPYVSHPYRVALTVRDVFDCADEVALAAALLHDVIEDTPSDYDEVAEQFGDEVAACVAALSKNMLLPEAEREAAYDAGLERADWRAKLIKLADTYDNLCDAIALVEHDAGRSLERSLERSERALAIARGEGPSEPLERAIAAVERLSARARPLLAASREGDSS